MHDAEDFEWDHETDDSPVDAAVDKVYRAALRSLRPKGKPLTRAMVDAAYARTLEQVAREHPPTSDHVLKALFWLARFRNTPAEWLTMFDRERARFGAICTDAGGTLGWMGESFPSHDPRGRVLFRWSEAMSRAANDPTPILWSRVDALIDDDTEEAAPDGWRQLWVAEVCGKLAALASSPTRDASTQATRWDERLPELPNAFAYLGGIELGARVLHLLATLEPEDGEELEEAAASLRATKPKSLKPKGHPFLQAAQLLSGELAPLACPQASALLANIPATPPFLVAPAERLRDALALIPSIVRGVVPDPLPAEPLLAAFSLLAAGRATEARAHLGAVHDRLTSASDVLRWELHHACAAALGEWEVLETLLDEMRGEAGSAPLATRDTWRVTRAITCPSVDARRASLLKEIYGVDLPDDVFALAELAKSTPTFVSALETIEMGLVGPFDVLAGRIDERRPAHSMLLHWRKSFHPPEYLPLVVTAEHNLSYGYWLDDWTTQGIDARFAVWTERWQPIGRTAADIIRHAIERLYAGLFEEYFEGTPAERKSIEHHAGEALTAFETLRARLLEAGGSNDANIGAAYLSAKHAQWARQSLAVGGTSDFLVGLGCEPGKTKPTIRGLELQDAARDASSDHWVFDGVAQPQIKTHSEEEKRAAWARVLDFGASAVAEKRPWDALSCGGFVWREGDVARSDDAFRLLDDAYALLGREGVRRVLRVHHAERWLENVDLLNAE